MVGRLVDPRVAARVTVAMVMTVGARALLAQEAPGPQAVSIQDVVRLARERAPAIAAARARVIRAEGEAIAARRFPDPELGLGLGRARPDGAGLAGREFSFGFIQVVPLPWARDKRVRAANAIVVATQADVGVVIADVVAEARRIYYEAAVDQREAAALEAAAGDAETLRQVMQRRTEVGEASGADRLRTDVEALRARAEAVAARARADANRAALSAFLQGAIPPDFVPADGDVAHLPPIEEAGVEARLQQHPLYAAATARLNAARAALAAERASRVPSLFAAVSRDSELDKRATSASLGFVVPLWNRNAGAIRVAEGGLAEAEAEAARMLTDLRVQAAQLVRGDRAAREQALTYQGAILPAATRALSIVRFSLEQGEANLLAWFEARRSYLEILRAANAAQRDALLRRAELQRVLGGLDEIR